MDIVRFVVIFNVGLITQFFAPMVRGDPDSIFEVRLGTQPSICSSLIIPKNESIADPTIIHPPAIKERINYEYTINTPNFPFSYPTNIHCTTLIKAPNLDYNIILEVRQLFDVEPSKNCVRDFLEITDGPYGFSKRIGRFCNSEKPPKEVKSTGPFLWLRFRSDSSLPHNGFTIAYRFIRNTNVDLNINYCYKQTMIPPGNSFNFNTSFILSELKKSAIFKANESFPMECVFDFHVHPGFNTFMYKEMFKKPNLPLPCSSNRLEIYSKGTFENDVFSPEKHNYLRICEETDFVKHLFKYSTRTTLRIAVKDLTKMNGISLIMTSVIVVKDICPDDYFLCPSIPKQCISKNLLCNGETNCPTMEDENCIEDRILQPGEEKNVTTTTDPVIGEKNKARIEEEKILERTNITHGIILGSIASVLIISMVLCLFLTIHSKKKDKVLKHVNVIDIPIANHDKTQNKHLFYELLQSSEPSVMALSTEKLSRKVYHDNHNWSKKSLHDPYISIAHKNNDSTNKQNGAVRGDFTIRSSSTNHFKPKTNNSKDHSLNKIGKYLSVPNPLKNDLNIKPIIPNKSSYHIEPFNVTSQPEYYPSWSSNTNSKQNSSIHHIQRASSMGSGSRMKFLEHGYVDEASKNVDWYCGPVIKRGDNQNNSSEMLNAYSAKSSQHVPGCRSLPNFSNLRIQNPEYHIKIIPIIDNNHETDLSTGSVEENSSYKDDAPSTYFQSPYQRNSSSKHIECSRNNGGPTTQYGLKYFCAHESKNRNNFQEYIA